MKTKLTQKILAIIMAVTPVLIINLIIYKNISSWAGLAEWGLVILVNLFVISFILSQCLSIPNDNK
jgi:hypothetical protein